MAQARGRRVSSCKATGLGGRGTEDVGDKRQPGKGENNGKGSGVKRKTLWQKTSKIRRRGADPWPDGEWRQ